MTDTSTTPMTQPPKEPTFAPQVIDADDATGRGSEGNLQGRKGGEATGIAQGDAETAQKQAEDTSRAPEEENHS